jgi:hypothetical protein
MAVWRSYWKDEKARSKRGIELPKKKSAHIASPEVVVDEDNQQIYMYFHGQRDSLT